MRADVSGSVPPSLKKETGHLKVLYNDFGIVSNKEMKGCEMNGDASQLTIFGCMKEVLDRSDVVDHDLDR